MDCDWEYGELGQCSRSCGGGISKQFPKINTPAQFGGRPCPDESVPKEIPCNNNPCPGEFIQTLPSLSLQDQKTISIYFYDFSTTDSSLAVPCEWEWGQFGRCSKTCGGGTRSRIPVVIHRERHGGECPADVVNGVPDTESCNTGSCPGEPIKGNFGGYNIYL